VVGTIVGAYMDYSVTVNQIQYPMSMSTSYGRGE
jgi:hypothetical protein